MCYSIESSLRTTLLSAFAIVYLISSNIPHYQWLGATLIGWCLMQFAEMLIWLTKPRTQCTTMNKILKFTIIPFTLMLQPLAGLWGSLFVFPWNKSSVLRKQFLVGYSIAIILAILIITFYNTKKTCTFVTKQGHLYWGTFENENSPMNMFFYYIWLLLIALQLLLFWDKSYLLIVLIAILPIFGFQEGLNTDSGASIWCHYTSYTSVIASIALFMQQYGIYKFI